ncbi:cytochrome P450 [Crepidotus variabilis]|uniref:Cytochrome P450 n=1 Tax=Crepidotus variabilis TaxID=179855 RepID=A0A9P6E5H0_9AGAR|nr:cytochrome P450 [Crepidotus variabilis]
MMLKLIFTIGSLVAGAVAVNFWKALKDMEYLPGYRPMLAPLTLFGAALPSSRWNLGLNWSWIMRSTAFFNYSHDVISMVPWLHGEPAYYTCSAEVAQQLIGNEGQRPLIRPRKLTSLLLLWGENVFSSNGDMWKRHRRIMSPAFNPKMYSLVLKQTTAIYREMADCEGLTGNESVIISDFSKLPLRLAFLVIARCGFGMPLTWAMDEQETADKISVNHALTSVTETAIARLMIPNWAYKIPIKALKEIDHHWTSLAKFMRKSVGLRAEELKADADLVAKRGDVFTRLVAANIDDGKYSVNEDEVLGNTFMLLFAGHETTALVLTATFAYLGIHQEAQEKAYKEITSTIREDRDLDVPKLVHTLACFNEALRLYPAGSMLTRTMTEDVVVNVKRPAEATMVFKKGSLAIIDMVAVHRNPHTYTDPHAFKPSRWYGVSDHDLTMFGNGPRSCIGRKFSQMEAVTFISLFLRDWHVDVVMENGETRQEYENRVMSKAGQVGMSFGITEKVNLRLTKRLKTTSSK